MYQGPLAMHYATAQPWGYLTLTGKHRCTPDDSRRQFLVQSSVAMLELFETMSQCFVELKIVIANCLSNITLKLFYNLHVHAQHSIMQPLKLLTHTITFRSLTLSKILLFLIFYYCEFNV